MLFINYKLIRNFINTFWVKMKGYDWWSAAWVTRKRQEARVKERHWGRNDCSCSHVVRKKEKQWRNCRQTLYLEDCEGKHRISQQNKVREFISGSGIVAQLSIASRDRRRNKFAFHLKRSSWRDSLMAEMVTHTQKKNNRIFINNI